MLRRVSRILSENVQRDAQHDAQQSLHATDNSLHKLMEHQHTLHNYVQEIQQSNIKHKKEIVAQIQRISLWIDHLHTNHLSLKKDVHLMMSDLKSTIKDDFTTYHSILLNYIDSKMERQRLTLEEKHQELEKKMTTSIAAKSPAIKYTPIAHAEQATPIVRDLNGPENLLLNIMFNEDKPMTYDELALKMGKSINSVRVYMNSLRNKRDVIEEFNTPSGKKIFSIKNAEMVKTLFNIV